MKQLRRIVQRGTALLPAELTSLKQNKAIIVLKSHPFTEKALQIYKTRKLFSWIVLFPFLIALIYIVFMQSPLYESTAKIVVEKDDPAPLAPLGMLSGGHAAPSEIYLTREYIVSREVLNKVDSTLNLKNLYQAKNIDYFSRLGKSTQTSLLNYYRHKVKAVVDPETGEIHISASAFSPEASKKLLNQIIINTKDFVNRVSNTMARKQYNFAKLKLKLSKEKLFEASKEVIEWQNQNGLFDPRETAQVVSTVMAKLKGTLVEKQTEYITYSSFMQPNANKLITLQEEIKALKNQITQQTNLLLGQKEKNGKLNKIMNEFELLQLQLKFAQAEYEAAQQAYDAAGINLAKNQNMVIVIEPPNLPDEISSPWPLYDLTNVFIVLLIFFALTKMAIIIVKEHID